MLAELHSGLLDVPDAHRLGGRPDDAAVGAATAEFGEPRVIAATFQSEPAVLLARTCALTLAGTGPVAVSIAWLTFAWTAAQSCRAALA